MAMQTSVSVNDIEFEPEQDGRTRACMSVAVMSEDHDLDFSLTFGLPDQPGLVESTLEEGRSRLINLFEAALAKLNEGPLRRN